MRQIFVAAVILMTFSFSNPSFEPEAFHLQISSINLEETFVLLYISHVFQHVQPLHQQQVNLGR